MCEISSDYDSEEDNGFHFDPSDQEIIQQYLIPKRDNKLSEDFNLIEMKDVYAKEPWLLNHNNNPFLMEDEWYYFTTRTQISDKKPGCGNNVKRKINNDGIGRGYWKANQKENIIDENTGDIIGYKQTLTFIKSENNKKMKKQKTSAGESALVSGSEDSWIMKEYTLPDTEIFQNLVICTIRRKKVSKNKAIHHQEASTSTYYPRHQEASTSSERDEIVPEKSSEGDEDMVIEDYEGWIEDYNANMEAKGWELS